MQWLSAITTHRPSRLWKIALAATLWTAASTGAPRLAHAGSGHAAASSQASAARRIVGYVPAWERGNGYLPGQIDFGVVTTVAHFAVTPLPDGTLAPPDWGPFPDPALVTRAHATGASIVLVIGGDHPAATRGFAAVVQPELRPIFVAQVRALVDADGYDGIDLDWEFPHDAAARDGLTDVVAALRAALGPTRTLSLSVPASGFWGEWFDVAALAPNVDWFGVMTYGLSGPSWDDHSDSNAALFPGRSGEASVDTAVSYYVGRGAPPEKLLVGLPFFGQRFDDATALHQPLKHSGGTTISYPEVLDLVAEGWAEQWDPVTSVPFLTAPAAPGLVSYDDPRSFGAKCSYVRTHALGGVLLWHVGQDLRNGAQPLLAAAGACR